MQPVKPAAPVHAPTALAPAAVLGAGYLTVTKLFIAYPPQPSNNRFARIRMSGWIGAFCTSAAWPVAGRWPSGGWAPPTPCHPSFAASTVGAVGTCGTRATWLLLQVATGRHCGATHPFLSQWQRSCPRHERQHGCTTDGLVLQASISATKGLRCALGRHPGSAWVLQPTYHHHSGAARHCQRPQRDQCKRLVVLIRGFC